MRWIYGCCKRAVSTSGYLTSGDLKRRHRQGPLQRLLTGREDDLTPTNAQDMLRLLGYTVQMHSSARPTKLLAAPDKSTSAHRAELAIEYDSSDLDDDNVAKGTKRKRNYDAEHVDEDAYPSRSDLTDFVGEA